MQTRIEPREIPDPIALDKRQCLPFVVHTACPKCGVPDERDLTRDYISYPVIGAPEHIHFECADCEHEYSVRVVVGLTLTVAP